jgi:hypothetical protein
MATTETAKGVQTQWPELISVVDLSTIDPADVLNVSHGGPTGAKVARVSHEVTTPATSKDLVGLRHTPASDSLANDTARIEVDTVAGGDLAGAVVRVYFHFIQQASGGNRAANS